MPLNIDGRVIWLPGESREASEEQPARGNQPPDSTEPKKQKKAKE